MPVKGGIIIEVTHSPLLKLIIEGTTKIWVVDVKDSTRRGPSSAKVPVFYNPVMEFNRDLSILVMERFLKDLETQSTFGTKIRLLDGLAGTGIRGVRICHEVKSAQKPEVSVMINDYNPLAHKLILKNIEENQITSAVASNHDLNRIPATSKFNYIDVDPFGSPIKFLDASLRMLRNNGILAVTATDTATLFGSYPKTCLRRYDALSCRSVFSHELGVRILIGSCVRTAARYNIGLRPLLSHATDHYYRVYLKCLSGRSRADSSLVELGYVIQSGNSNEFRVITTKELFSGYNVSRPTSSGSVSNIKPSPTNNLAGPLWTGLLYDPAFIKHLKVGSYELGTKKMITKILELMRLEVSAPLGFYDTNYLASELKLTTPPLKEILKGLTDHGYHAVPTHFNPNAFKTDAKFDDIAQIIKNI